MPFSVPLSRRIPVQCAFTYNARQFLKLLLAYLCFGSLMTLLVLRSGSAYAEWVAIAGDDEAGMTVYVDPDTIRRNGDLVKMWHMSDRKTMEGYGSIKTQREYDCAEARHRLLAATIFSGHMGQGTLLDNNLKEGQWITVAPDGGSQALWKFACGKK